MWIPEHLSLLPHRIHLLPRAAQVAGVTLCLFREAFHWKPNGNHIFWNSPKTDTLFLASNNVFFRCQSEILTATCGVKHVLGACFFPGEKEHKSWAGCAGGFLRPESLLLRLLLRRQDLGLGRKRPSG